MRKNENDLRSGCGMQRLKNKTKNFSKNIDMTVGSPFRNIFLFAIPVVLNLLFQQLYSFGDTLIISLSRGSEAVTGVNITGSVGFLTLGAAQGFSAGFTIVLSQYVGAKDEENMRRSFATSVVLSVAVSVVMSLVFVPMTSLILDLLNTDELYRPHSMQYLSTMLSGIIFSVFYNLAASVMRAMGDSKTPLIILLLSAVMNVGLNSLLFITDMGVWWAAMATLISNGVAAALGFVLIFKKYPELRLNKSHFKMDARFCLKHLAFGAPMALEFAITAFSCMIQQRAFNSLDDPLYAMAQSTASQIDNIFHVIIKSIAPCVATYCAQNYGAGKGERIMPGIKASLLVGGILTAIAMVGDLVLAVPLARLFLPDAPEKVYGFVVEYAVKQLVFYYGVCLVYIFRNALQGLGMAGVAAVGGVVELLMRVFAAFVLAKHFSFSGACFSNPLAWIGAASMLGVAFFALFKRVEERIKKESAGL